MFLPNNESTFHFKKQGERSKEWFEGVFTVKCLLNQAEQIQVAIINDRYNGGVSTLPPKYALLNRTLAELEARIVKAPTWWTESQGGKTLYDTDIIFEVFKKAFEAEESWLKKVEDATKEATANAEKPETK